ncbi:MAG: potassium channel family protein, partial [Thermodesulfobacteriota bacterium]|nr:potassium channel family protein [Thermodesulfobacteriota bacterium]
TFNELPMQVNYAFSGKSSFYFYAILHRKFKQFSIVVQTLANNGENYTIERRSDNDTSQQRFYELFEKHNGAFFPFGFKDYRLRRLIDRLDSGRIWRKARSIPFKIFQSFLYRFERLTFVITIYCAIVTPICKMEIVQSYFGYYTHCVLLAIMAIMLVIMNILLSVEAVYSYGVLGSYATAFHMMSAETEKWAGGSNFLLELRVLVGKVITTIVAGATAFYVSHVSYITLGGNISTFESEKPISAIVVYLQSMYFSLTTLLTVGYGDINPKPGLGQLVSFLVQLQSFALLGIVLTTIASFALPKSE